MADSFGSDRRITYLTGKIKVGFYMWDLECLEMVVSDLLSTDDSDKVAAESLYAKIKNAVDLIENQR